MNAKYIQIQSAIRQQYIDGQPADQPLPTERALAQSFDVNRATVRRALLELESEGLLYRIQGAGTFTMGPTIAKTLKLASFSEEVRDRGMVASARVVSAVLQPAGAKMSQVLHISPGEEVVCIRRVRYADAEPMCVETSVVRAADAPGLLDEDLTQSLYALMESLYGLRIARAEQVVTATVTDLTESEELSVPLLTPALRITRTAMDPRSRPIEHSTSLYRSDRYEIRMTIRRDQ